MSRPAKRARAPPRWLAATVGSLVLELVLGTTWLWQKGYSVEQAALKIQSFFISIHVEPEMQSVLRGNLSGVATSMIIVMKIHQKQPVHEVTIKPFAIGKFEVTFRGI